MLRMSEAFALLADPILDRHLDVVERDFPRPVVDDELLRSQQAHAGRFHIDDKRRDTAARSSGAVVAAISCVKMRVFGAGDETLGAID